MVFAFGITLGVTAAFAQARRLLTKAEARSPRARGRHWWRETSYLGRLDRTIGAPKLAR